MGRQLFKQGYCSSHILIYQFFFKKISNLNLFIRQTGHLIIYIIDVDLPEGIIMSLKASWVRAQ